MKMNKIDEKFKIDINAAYEKKELLAKNYLGVYGLVYKAVNKKSSETVLLKEIDLTGIPLSGRQEIYKEAIFLSTLQHENFLKFLGYQEMKDRLLYTIEYPDEFLLESFLENENKHITNEFLLDLLQSVLTAFQYLEKNESASFGKLELTLDNIVLMKNGAIKLCDVVESLKIVKNVKIEQGFSSEDNKGFYSPEEFSLKSMIQKGVTTEFKSLIFSLGMIICRLIEPEAFGQFVEERMSHDSQENMNTLLLQIKEKVSFDIFNILVLMTNFDARLRYDSATLLTILKNSGKTKVQKEEAVTEISGLKDLIKKKDKDIFILKDQLRVANEQTLKLTQENEKMRCLNVNNLNTEKEINPM